MMKKFLVLALVLVVSTIANAALLEMAVVGNVGMTPTYTFGDIAQGDWTPGQYDLAVVVKTDTISGCEFGIFGSGDLTVNSTSAGMLIPLSNMYIAGSPQSYTVDNKGGLTIQTGITDIAVLNDGFTSGYVTVYNFSVTVGELGGSVYFDAATGTTAQDAATVRLLSDGSYVVDNSNFQGVTFVPEPMTVALLGLGGLFIRRRKA